MQTEPDTKIVQTHFRGQTSLKPREDREDVHVPSERYSRHQVISTYNRWGVVAVETPGKGGRRHQYLTLEEEQQFLAPFFARAEAGEIATVREIWQAFEERVGHPVDDSTIYRLLDRHGWRQLMPRPRHPRADPHAQEQFKKPLKRRLKRQSQRGHRKINARC